MMDDRNMVTPADALQQVTGVKMELGSDVYSNNYYARGYSMSQMQDGMPGMYGNYQQYDLAIYDRLEVVRGPFGLLQGSGNPSGTINFVKKLPRDRFAISAAASGGSWDNYYGMFDVTGPLTKNKSVRARLVMSGQDRDFFWDRDHEQNWTDYGIIEADLFGPQTTFFLSLLQQEVDNPGYSGNPSYTTGPLIHFPWSFSPYPKWNKYIYRNQEVMSGVEHKFDSGWIAKVKVRHSEQHQHTHEAYPSTGVNPTTMTLSYIVREGQYQYEWNAMDLYVYGPFDLFNRTHKLLLGWNYDSFSSGPNANGSRRVNNISIFDLGILNDEQYARKTNGGNSEYWQSGYYGKLQIQVFKPLTVVLGGRLSDYTSQSRNVYPSTPTAWKRGYRVHNELTKYGAIIYDVHKNVSLYASYSDIFVPQSSRTWPDGILDPRVGEQYEIGSKGEFFDKKLNVYVAAFSSQDKNRANEDPDHPNYYLPRGVVETQGLEAEIVGSPLPGLDLFAGWTYATTKYKKDDDYQGQDYNTWMPTQMLKLWGLYHFQGGLLKNFSLGGGANAYSDAKTQGRNYIHKQPTYVLFNAQAGYKFSKNLSATFSCNNLFNKKYYADLGAYNVYNTYGEPRSFMLTLRASFE